MRRRVQLSANAAEQLDALIATHHLPPDTTARLARVLRPLERFPVMGAPLDARAQLRGLRFLLGPWRWMLIVYTVLDDPVVAVAIEDARASNSLTSGSDRG